MALINPIEKSTGFKLNAIDPSFDGGLSKKEGEKLAEKLGAEMGELLDLLFAAGMNSCLVVLQGRDTSGKYGTIRHLLQYVNAQSTRVAPFKVPSTLELSHDFLWRCHMQAPAKGGMTIFDRSHYEDVLVVRVHNLVPKEVWGARYDHINAFEKLMSDSGTIILKFCLLISKDEQEERLKARELEVEKAWKLSANDWKERELWDEYSAAYEDAIAKCATKHAPWHVIPSNKKWFRNLAITESIVERLRLEKPNWMAKLNDIGEKAKAELEAYRGGLEETPKG